MKKQSKTEAYRVKTLVDNFNKRFPVGSEVLLRKVSLPGYEYKPYKVRHKAYLMSNGSPVAFFQGIAGCFSIEPEFIQY